MPRYFQLVASAILCTLFVGPAQASTAVHSSPPAARTSPPASGSVGYDVGDLSCSTALPAGGSFGVIGTTAGRPFHPSPCLAAEYLWARALSYRPEYYVNLADPGRRSSHWGHGGPRTCHRRTNDDAGCAYNYGDETAAAAWHYATAVGSNGYGRWWLDVEVDNTWGHSRAGIAANKAVIRGALHYLRRRPHTTVGIYTETSWWQIITADSRRFAGTPVWGGGANSRHNARRNCRKHSITGARAVLAQWIVGSVDHDLAC